MQLYDTVSSAVKTTLPRHMDSGFIPLFFLCVFVLIGQMIWLIQAEKMYRYITDEKSCWARRMAVRFGNRAWNNRVLHFTKQRGLDVFPAGDASFSAYVGSIETLNDLNGSPDGSDTETA